MYIQCIKYPTLPLINFELETFFKVLLFSKIAVLNGIAHLRIGGLPSGVPEQGGHAADIILVNRLMQRKAENTK